MIYRWPFRSAIAVRYMYLLPNGMIHVKIKEAYKAADQKLDAETYPKDFSDASGRILIDFLLQLL